MLTLAVITGKCLCECLVSVFELPLVLCFIAVVAVGQLQHPAQVWGKGRWRLGAYRNYICPQVREEYKTAWNDWQQF